MIRRFTSLYFTVLGAVFLLSEIFGWECPDRNYLLAVIILAVSMLISLIAFLVDGYFFLGFLKSKISLSSNAFDTKINIEVGDILNKKGWKITSVNDFFDNKVDDRVISSSSLHGQMIRRFWSGDADNWYEQVLSSVSQNPIEEQVLRDAGKDKRFPIGTVAVAKQGDDKFICVALSRTNSANHLAESDSYALHESIRCALSKAREVVNGQRLYIPIMGAGLSRTGIKFNAIIHFLLVAIFEESKKQKITNEITIVIPKDKRSEINLINLLKEWR